MRRLVALAGVMASSLWAASAVAGDVPPELQARLLDALKGGERALAEHPDPAYLCQALCWVGEAEAKLGDRDAARATLGRAREVSRTIDDQEVKAEWFSYIAMLLAKVEDASVAGAFEEAEAAAAAIEAPETRAEVLIRIGEEQAQAGLKDEARETLERAVEVAESVQPPKGSPHWTKAWLLALVANAQAVAGEREAAREIARRAEKVARSTEGIEFPPLPPDLPAEVVGDPVLGFTPEMVSTLLFAHLPAGNIDEAIALLRGAEITLDPTQRLLDDSVVEALGDPDLVRPEDAERFLKAFLESVEELEATGRDLSACWEDLARVAIWRGQPDNAVRIGEELLRREDRSALMVLNPIGQVLATAGRKDDARRLLRETSRIVRDDEAILALWAIAETQAMVGDAEGASQTIQAAEAIERTTKPEEPPAEVPEALGFDPLAFRAGMRVRALATFAECQAGLGQDAVAEELVGRTLDALPQSEGHQTCHDFALFRITRAQAALGDFDALANRLRAFEESGEVRTALERGIAIVARERFLAGDEERGHRLLGFVTDADSRASAVERAAIGRTRRGEEEAALRWVSQIEDPYARASGLAAIVRGLTETEEERARDIPEVEP